MKVGLALFLTLLCTLPAWCRSPNAADHKKPAITITAPTSASTYATTATPLMVGGTASDNVGVRQVTWTNAAGGSGTATGTTIWSSSIPLTIGSNLITVTAYDAAGNTATDTLTVTLMSSTPPPGPITVDWSFSGSGDTFQMERCVAPQPCPMASVAAIAIGDRTWTDNAVSPSENYCYRMAVTTGGVLGAYSNTLCSP